MELTDKQRQLAFASWATHRLAHAPNVVLVRTNANNQALVSHSGKDSLGEDCLGRWYLSDVVVSELKPINWLGTTYSRADISRHIKWCPPMVLEAMSSEVYAYPETKRAPVTQQHADCWGVTVQAVWEWALPAFSRAVQAGYPVSIYVHPSSNTVGV